MGSFEYLADGHHVDDAGNLISCPYVDFRDPAPDDGSTIVVEDGSAPPGSRIRGAAERLRRSHARGRAGIEAGHGRGLQRFTEALPATAVEALREQRARVEAPIGRFRRRCQAAPCATGRTRNRKRLPDRARPFLPGVVQKGLPAA